ncbi:MAG: hypothetical protein ACK5ML_04325 [Lachnospiraceae bacterium]
MNAKVIKRYSDKYTHKAVEVGTILTDLSEKRAEELIKDGRIEEIKEKVTKKTEQ